MARGLTYSQAISWLKILLPLVALVLLSTMFMFARSVAPTSTIPFAKIELEERAKDQRITAPFFAGQTATGHDIAVQATSARPDGDNPQITHAETLDARINMQTGSVIDISSQFATMNSKSFDASLSGDVLVTSSNGYDVTTQELVLNLDQGTARSDTEIQGKGPAGHFTAGAMEMTHSEETDTTRFLFTNGVKLIYTPQ